MGELGAIFDMDGVLVDSYRAHFVSWQQLADAHGLDFTEEQFASTFGKTSREIIRQFWSDRVCEDDIPQWDSQKEAFYRDILRANFPEMDGASELIRLLRADGFALAIGSSGPSENVRAVLDCLPGGALFAAAVNGHDVTHGKPAPDVFLKAAEKLALPADRCVVIEDAPVGVEAAHRAGMVVAALTGTASREQLARADLVVDSLGELNGETLSRLIARHNA